MKYVIVGLGNPGEEYVHTRHNAGHIIVAELAKRDLNAKLVPLESMMNNSGTAVAVFVKNQKEAEKLVVIHDDLDLPLGAIKLSFGRGAGGHRGVDSIIKKLKTKDFMRVRVGICPVTASGKAKKPHGEQQVVDFILGKFKPAELTVLKKLSKKIGDALEVLISHGREAAMSQFN
jgi:PTH1 family peptidyl-tRNA hydrolase